MCVPDLNLICEIMLMAEGFQQSKLLSLLAFSLGRQGSHAKAVELAEEALRLVPAGHADRADRLAGLAELMRQAWVAGGHVDRPMIQRATALGREAKALRLVR